ncbi:dihydroorotase [Flavobacteriaceae bacterium]|jgi:dihydroorotase|nr:dihydroorotase [Flavobacteriaceae bacterium]
MTQLIKNAFLVNEGKTSQHDLRIQDGKILTIAEKLLPLENEEVIDATGKYLLPGLIDDQVHFREPGLTHKACIKSESRAAVSGGITSFIEMPNTVPQTTTVEKFDEKLAIAKENSLANYSFMFGGTNDNFDEIQRLDTSKVAGLKLFLGSSTGNMLVDNEAILRKIFASTDLVISVHCEDEPTVKANLAAHIAEYGEDIPIEKHPIIRSHEACYISSSKAIALAKETGARLHVFHLSTAIETELFDNTIPLKDKRITAEVCVHHLWFSADDYAEKGTLIKWNPAVKNEADRSALWAALNDDRIDVLATDHAPHTLEEKSNVYTKAPSGGPLVQHALLALLTAAKKGKITLEKLVEKACHNPAILFQIAKRGYLREGYCADLVLVDLDRTTTVTKEGLLYQCGWSPFEGTTFDAVIDRTWVNGKTVYANGKIIEVEAAQQLTFDR